MIHIWHTVTRSNNHSSLSVDFLKIPNREKHKIGRLYFINDLSPSHIMENTKFFSLFKIKQKPSEKLPACGKLFWASTPLEMHSALLLGLLLWKLLRRTALLVLFCSVFYAKVELRRTLKL